MVRVWMCSVFVFLALLGSSFLCATGSTAESQRGKRPAPSGEMTKGLQFRLSEGAEQSERRTPSEPARATPLAESDAQALLARLKPIKEDPSDEQEFAFRDRSLPPPLTGKTISEAFPASGEAARPYETNAGPFEVVRYAP